MTLSYIPSDTNDEGILKATASGTLPSGQAVIVNADGTVSVPSSTVGSEAVFNSANSFYTTAAFDSSSNKVVITYMNVGSSYDGTVIVGTVSGGSITFGSPVVFNSGESGWTAITFDSNSNKVVIAYSDNANSSYGTAIVCTVSGTSISFGSETVFNSANTQHTAMTFDSNSNKIVIAYRDQGDNSHGNAIVGTVSGTSISFGGETKFENAAVEQISATFDSSSNKVVVVYNDAGNSGYGTANVGTISGTSITFGGAVVFVSGYTFSNAATFDSSSNKVVISYRDGSNSNYGTAIVGTVSGTSISFGSSVVFSAATTNYSSIVFDSSTNKVVISYQGNGNLNGTIIVGTVSGTSISFGDGTVFNTGTSTEIKSTFDSNSNEVVTVYNDGGNSGYGTAVVYNPSGNPLTAENYIGISTGGTYASGSTATVKIIGNTSDEQSSLTAGQAYYVQTDGTLGLTAADPSVFAGTAISATKLLVKT